MAPTLAIALIAAAVTRGKFHQHALPCAAARAGRPCRFSPFCATGSGVALTDPSLIRGATDVLFSAGAAAFAPTIESDAAGLVVHIQQGSAVSVQYVRRARR